MKKLRKKASRFLAYALMALALFSIFYTNLPLQIRDQDPWLNNLCNLYLSIIVIFLLYELLRGICKICNDPVPWKRYDERNENAKYM